MYIHMYTYGERIWDNSVETFQDPSSESGASPPRALVPVS